MVCAGYHQATVLLCALLAARGARRIAFEDPSLRDHWQVAARAGLEPVPVALDGDGLRADALEATGADAVVITPSHQFPTGAVMGAERRHELLAWARGGRRLIVEDDYDAEFRYDRRPLARAAGPRPLARGLRRHGVQDARAGAAAGLGARAARSRRRSREIKDAADQGSPALDQIALADLFASGAHERHLRTVRRAYAERRALLVEELGAAVPGSAIEGAAAGVHLVLALPAPLDARAARRRDRRARRRRRERRVLPPAARPRRARAAGARLRPDPDAVGRPAVAALAAALRDAAA